MTTPATESAPRTPSRRALIGMVVVVLMGTLAAGLLESGLGGEPIVDYDDAIVDIAAVDELATRGIDPCPEVDEPVIPDDLAAGLEGTECVAYDTSAGLGPAIVGLAVLGAVIVIASGNRFGLYLLWLVLVLISSGIAEAYMTRGLLLRPGSLPLSELAAFWGATAWVVVGVLLVPRMILMFPSGQLPSPRWHWVPRATWIPASLLILGSWLDPLLATDIRKSTAFPIVW